MQNPQAIQVIQIRKATRYDLESIMQIYAYARTCMKNAGNPNQWHDNHPPQHLIEADIKAGHCYVCIIKESIVAVFYFNVEEEPTYKKINGEWLDNNPYGVIHRIARSPAGKGAGAHAIQWCITQHPNIRIDTHKDNAPMLKLLENLGFVYCGIIWVENGDPRVAYQKVAYQE